MIKKITPFVLLVLSVIFIIAKTEYVLAEDDGDDNLDQKIEFSHLYPTKLALYKDAGMKRAIENVNYHIEGENFIVQIPYSVSESNLIRIYMQVEVLDGEAYITDYEAARKVRKKQISQSLNSVSDSAISIEESAEEITDPILLDGRIAVDLTRKPILKIKMQDGRVEYFHLQLQYLTGDLPVLYISTKDEEGVNSRTEYVTGNLIIGDKQYDIEIKGRGNVSWWGYKQKSYLIKFDSKEAIFGYRPSKEYCLLSTYGDVSLIRNLLAMNIASTLDNMEFVPQQRAVDVFLDNEYKGVYTFSEKIDVGADKIDLFSDYSYEESLNAYSEEDPYDELGFLLELGGYSKESHSSGFDHFYSSHIRDVYIKYPKQEKLDQEYSDLIKNYIRLADNSTINNTYDKYLEIDSWVDWFIIMELSNNTDSAFQRSTYLYKKPGKGLYLGPIWDFDKAFGNYGMDNPDFDTWCSAESDYDIFQFNVMHYLYMSNSFMKKVQTRWDEKKPVIKEIAFDTIDDATDDIAFSRVYSEQLYHRTGSYSINQIRRFINSRYSWIDKSLHSDNYNRNPDRPTIKWNEDEEEFVEE